MIGWLVLLFILVIISGYLFFAPFYLEINTVEGLYRIRFHRLANVSLKPSNSSIILEVKIGGWRKQIDLFATGTISKGKPVEERTKRRKEKWKIPWQKIRGVVASFKVNKCRVLIDFGNVQLNAILYPVFYFVSVYTGKNIQTNFIGKNEIILEIENNLARMSWAYISS